MASSKITNKLLERFLYFIEKVGFAARQCDRLQNDEQADKSTPLSEKQPAQKTKNYEFVDVLKFSE